MRDGEILWKEYIEERKEKRTEARNKRKSRQEKIRGKST